MDIAFGKAGEFHLILGYEALDTLEVEGEYTVSGNKITVRGRDFVYGESVNYTFTFRFDGSRLILGWEGETQRTFSRADPDYLLWFDID